MDLVVGYKEQHVLDALEDGSVGAIFDKYAGLRTADRAMSKMRVGSTYLLLPWQPLLPF